MTRQRDFKKLVRERMSRTGESYTAARSHLLIEPSAETLAKAEPFAGVIAGYDRFGGLQGDTGALTNVFRFAGLRKTGGGEYSEALVNGLCGGIGFLYAVFEYKGFPPMLTIVARSSSMADTFVAEGLQRSGATLNVKETSSAPAARKHLDAALKTGNPAICTVDLVTLPYSALPKEWAGGAPHIVAAVGASGDDVWLDDRAVKPMRISMKDFAAARARYRKGKHRLVTLGAPEKDFDLAKAVKSACALTVKNFHETQFKGFASNFGFNGMEKWRRLLIDTRDAKGWLKVFPSHALAYAGLSRVYECVQQQYTAPAAGRPFYADFLAEASAITGDKRFMELAQKFRMSGELWDALTDVIRDCPDEAIKRRCEITDENAEFLDSMGASAAAEIASLEKERRELAQSCALTPQAAGEMYSRMAELLARIIPLERDAVEQLSTLSSN